MPIECTYRVYCVACQRYLKATIYPPGATATDVHDATEYADWAAAVADGKRCFRMDGTQCEECWVTGMSPVL